MATKKTIKLNKYQQQMSDQIKKQKAAVTKAFGPLESAYMQWCTAMDRRLLDVKEGRPGWQCANPHQREIDNLIYQTRKFAERMGVASYVALEVAMEEYQRVMDKIQENAII